MLLTLLVVGLAAAGWALWERGGWQPAPVVEVALDDASVREFARRQGFEYTDLLTRFRAAGVGSLVVPEVSLESLTGYGQMIGTSDFPVVVAVRSGAGLLADAARDGRSRLLAAPRPDESYVFVQDNPELLAWLERMFTARLGAGRVRPVAVAAEPAAAGTRALAVRAVAAEALQELPLGTFPPDVARAQRLGIRPIVSLTQRPAAVWNPIYTTADAPSLVAALPADRPPVILRGAEVPGYPDDHRRFGQALEGQAGFLLLVPDRDPDHPPYPAGIDTVLREMNFRAVRGLRADHRDTPAQWVHAVTTGNVRFLHLPLFTLTAAGERDLQMQLGRMEDLRQGLLTRGFRLGTLTPEPQFWPPVGLASLTVMGAAAVVGLLWLTLLGSAGRPWAALTVLACVGGFLYAGSAAKPYVAWLTAVAVPVLTSLLARAWLRHHLTSGGLAGGGRGSGGGGSDGGRGRGIGSQAAGAIVLAAVLAVGGVLGGLLVRALLPEPPFGLGMAELPGQLLVWLVPPVLVFAAAGAAGRTSLWPVVMAGWTGPLQVRAAAGAAVALALVVLLVLVTAGAAAAAGAAALLGYAAAGLAVRWGWRERVGEWAFALALAVTTLAPTAMVSGVAHPYTPLAVALVQAGQGLLVGVLVMGLVLGTVAWVAWRAGGESHG